MISCIKLLVQGKKKVLVSINHLPALSTYQMNVRPMLVRGIDRLPFPQINTTGEALLDQQFQGAVNRGDVHRAGAFLYPSEYFLCVNMIALMSDGFNNHLALGGDAEAT